MIWNLMDEQTDFIIEMSGKWILKWKWVNNGYVNGKYNGNEFGKRFDYNEKRV